MNKTLEKIHEIRERIYEEEKNLTKEGSLQKIRTESEEFMKKYNIKLRRIDRKLVEV